MYPILYPSTATTFTNNGLGILSGALSCEVEQKSTSFYELAMEYPTEGEEAVHWEDVQNRRLLRMKPTPKDSVQTFRIYNMQKLMNGNMLVSAQHISYDLSGYTVMPFDAYAASTAITKLAENCVQATGFTFWTDVVASGELHITKPITVRAALLKIQEAFGGEFEWDNWTVRLHASRGADRGVTIAYGKNLTDFRQEANFAEVYTGMHPYWIDGETKEVFQLTPPVVPVPDMTFDFTKILPYDFSSHYDEKPTAAQLEASALYHIEKYRIWEPDVSMSVSFEQLESTDEYKNQALLERISLYDTVHVVFPKFGGISVQAKAVEMRADMLRERITNTELGQYVPDVADTIAGTGRMVDAKIDDAMLTTGRMVQEAVENATNWITNGEGNIVIKRNLAGNPIELLVMDTADITTATKVWRWNAGGLGYSGTGYNGPYTTAMTQDGSIVANFITSGILSGDIVRAGKIISYDTNVSFDLDNSKMEMKYDNTRRLVLDRYGLSCYDGNDKKAGLKFVYNVDTAQYETELDVMSIETERIDMPDGGTIQINDPDDEYDIPRVTVSNKLDVDLAGVELHDTRGFVRSYYQIMPAGTDPDTDEPIMLSELSVDRADLHEGALLGVMFGSTTITGTYKTVNLGFENADLPAYQNITPIVMAMYESDSTIDSGDWPAIKIRNVSLSSFQIAYGTSGTTARPVKWVAFFLD